MSSFLLDPHGTQIDYTGPPLEEGPLPAFFYFALSGSESLNLSPYNQPVIFLSPTPPIRVFSFTIPGHEHGMNKFQAIQYWAGQMAEGHYILEDFFKKVLQAMTWLIETGIVHPEHIGLGGLSRGGFIATHIAARFQQARTLIGFAPLTDLMQLSEFASQPDLHRRASELSLEHLTDTLTHVRHIRFYIGNHDTRVNTDSCYAFVRKLAEKRQEKQARHQKIELMITQSVGQHGHGTEPYIFEEGASWAKKHIILS